MVCCCFFNPETALNNTIVVNICHYTFVKTPEKYTSHWKDWCWSWNSNTLATWCEELTHLKRPWCWERLEAGGEGDNRGRDGWMASLTQWTWVWVDSGSWWWTGRPGVLRFMGLQRVGHNWVTELNWKNQSSCKLWTLSGNDVSSYHGYWCINLSSSIVTNVSLWCKMLIVEEVVCIGR